MWLWSCELRQIGFRRRSRRYWQCERRFGLTGNSYISIFIHTVHSQNDRECLEISAFHVTFQVGIERVHFYYHEMANTHGSPAGTPRVRSFYDLGSILPLFGDARMR